MQEVALCLVSSAWHARCCAMPDVLCLACKDVAPCLVSSAWHAKMLHHGCGVELCARARARVCAPMILHVHACFMRERACWCKSSDGPNLVARKYSPVLEPSHYPLQSICLRKAITPVDEPLPSHCWLFTIQLLQIKFASGPKVRNQIHVNLIPCNLG